MTSTVASMQAALLIREKQRLRRKKPRGRSELPSNVATREIAPFPRYPPLTWGKAAWQEQRGATAAVSQGLGPTAVARRQSSLPHTRPSLTDAAASHRCKASEAHRRWMKRNRIRDASSGEYSYYGGFRAGGAASALLYVGLGTVAVGLVISFVGLGEKGFKTLELRMIGPGLIVGGLLLCLLRIFLCTCCPPPLPPPPCCLRKHFRLWRQRASARGQRNSAKAENEDEEAATSRCGFEEARLLKGTRKKVSPEVPPTTTTSSSQALSGSAPGLKRKPVVRHGPLPVTPVALHTDRRAAEATSSTPVVPPPPSGRTQLPNQVPGGDSDEERRVGEVGRTGASRKKAVGSTVSRGRTNKVWSEVSGGPPEGRWVAPDDERSGRIRDSRVEAGREGDWAGRGLANPDPEAHQVEGGEQQRTQRTSAGASRRVRTQRQSSSRTDKELVLSPASLEGL
ncbi:uncharacterized protein LOC124162164 isoform X2 [Ischnura elegans]|uniref:uncharacterized protein LOC124162164 isoform X2 n=1 Tax=Ischnura elegans TaxID=197161 RepID=UPI001ED86727|nr:uncharacterized protein LOC124162164 isoform X2 [Ischnura elegans]